MHRRLFFFCGVLLLAILFRFVSLGSLPPGLFLDEAVEGNQALNINSLWDLKLFYSEDNGREGMFVWLAAIPLHFAGNRPLALRSVSAIGGVSTVLGLYLFVQEIYGWQLASLASLLLATSFWHTLFSRFGIRGVLAPCFAVWGMYAFYRALKHPYRYNYVVAGVLWGLGLYTYLPFRLMPVVLIGMAVAYRPSRENLIALTIAFLLVATPLIAYFCTYPGEFVHRADQISASPRQALANIARTALMFNYRGDAHARHNVSNTPELPPAIGIFFLIGILFAAARRDKIDWILFLWFAIALVPGILSIDAPHSLRVILAAPVVYIFAAGGVWWTYERLQRHRIVAVVATIAILFSVLAERNKYFRDWARNPELPLWFNQLDIDFAHKVETLPRDVPKYILVNRKIDQADRLFLAETVMFTTDTYTSEKQRVKNLYYVGDVPPKGGFPGDAIVIPLYQ
jgi:4-amino-4-deoxy-L-arabinose transferase-like glycosyltransferase